ncbi:MULTISPECIES: GNAT family N-acetyltransferase [unclassified Adlercreutzia]|uniref:GNAT family N-acetyltransferase n=1 Tax=unclassified Adlercreutzia TaxID=2636013 RepID=UPI0013EC7139|nr:MULTISPECIES: GNAT family N-acetyltransferase [unclassified Adlercreutzia]
MSGFSKPVQLKPGVGIADFHCGDKFVDNWVKKHSASARKRGSAVIYAVYYGDVVAGFYTLSAHSVTRADIDGGWFVRNAPQQVPAILLGMMGVDERFQGCGLGASLLRDAIQNALKVANLAGARALIVDPLSETAELFYEHFGFMRLSGTNRMALKLG